jgi:cbb3-type cytochrome oxidase subunit 3
MAIINWFLKLKLWQKGLLLFFLIGFIGSIFSPETKENNNNKETVPLDSAQAMTQKIEGLFSGWNGSLPSLVKSVKGTMNDPDSFEHVETRYGKYQKKHFVVSMKFRGKNAFGGVITKFVDAKVDYEGNVLEIDKEY